VLWRIVWLAPFRMGVERSEAKLAKRSTKVFSLPVGIRFSALAFRLSKNSERES
jgi:hypothetical protein